MRSSSWSATNIARRALEEGVAKGRLLAECAALARDLVNEPANVVNPVRMAEVATEMANEAGLSITVLGREDMIEHGMGAMLAVTAGSINEPRLIIMEHRGDPEHPENNVAIVGKGITFDSGGISIKPSASMWEMKGDMSGGASVIGAMKAIAAGCSAHQRLRGRARRREHAIGNRATPRRHHPGDERQNHRG